ncbi:DivIVA domain-containing protein [Corynebacterium sp.]|uniref:DivIVA domain-containing protein n=1 Tax=Corynebacterium sp. TaxID=1720 RepID=UPI0026237033|nr:DivIVA domain-containing protein [Corynebacterium sp.]
MYWIFSIAGAALVAGLLVYLVGRVFGPGEYAGPRADHPAERQAAEFRENCELTGVNLRQVKFTRSLRGYDAAEVDALLDRLATHLGDPGQPGDYKQASPAAGDNKEDQQAAERA